MSTATPQPENASSWTEEQEEFLLTNAGFFPQTALCRVLQKSDKTVRNKMKAMRISGERKKLPPGMSDLDMIPFGTKQFRTRAGAQVYRIPTSTPGIPMRTVHICLHDGDE